MGLIPRNGGIAVTPASAVLEFYLGTGSDLQGRTLEQIWSFSDAQLESIHDYIQWLFPTSSPSNYNPLAPTLDASTIRHFRDSEALQEKLLRSLDLMLRFFGLDLQPCQVAPTVSEAPGGKAQRRRWQVPGNHNLLRLTRILESLHFLGLQRYALSFYVYLEAAHLKSPRRIPYDSLCLWRSVVGLSGPPPRAGFWTHVFS